jgi:hypothetical protein
MDYKEIIKLSLDDFDNKYLDHKKHKDYKNKDLIAIVNDGIWQWAWSLTDKPDNLLKLSKKLLLYGLDLDYKKDNQELKKILLTSHIKYSSYTQFEIFIAISIFLTKSSWYYQDEDHVYILS